MYSEADMEKADRKYKVNPAFHDATVSELLEKYARKGTMAKAACPS